MITAALTSTFLDYGWWVILWTFGSALVLPLIYLWSPAIAAVQIVITLSIIGLSIYNKYLR
jgi:hypothetical protein